MDNAPRRIDPAVVTLDDPRASKAPDHGPPPLGLGAALALGFMCTVALAAVFLYIPQAILTDMEWGSRSTRVWAITVWVAAAFVALAWATWRWSDRR